MERSIQDGYDYFRRLHLYNTSTSLRCLLSAGAHAVDHSFSMETIEKAIIEEFGQCLTKIIEKGLQKGAAENKTTK